MVKLKRLKLEKYRNVKPGTELHFRDSLNVLLGRNGTGKTTLLNLIVQLLSWDFSRFQNEAVALEYELTTSRAELTVRLRTEALHAPGGAADARKLPDEMFAMGLVQSAPRYAAMLEVEIVQPGTEAFVLRLKGSKLTLARRGEAPFQEVSFTQSLLVQQALVDLIFALDDSLTVSEPESLGESIRALWSDFRGLSFLQRFDECLEYLGHITRQDSFVALKAQGGGGPYLVSPSGGPRFFARRLMEVLDRDPQADEIRFDSSDEEAGFLARLVGLLGFESAQVRLQRTSRTAGPDAQLEFGNIQFQFTRRDGSIINHSLLSYGQKRLLAFFYYLASNPACVVADELVNGMHHEWIEACLEDLGERQAFLTSQNPLLLDYLSFESAEEARSSFVLCRTELQDGGEQMVWENMTEEDSEGFFKAYQVAIQHVSELLRIRGLW